MFKQMKLKSIWIISLLFVVFIPNVIGASSTKSKSPELATGFDTHIPNNSLAVSPDEQIAIVVNIPSWSMILPKASCAKRSTASVHRETSCLLIYFCNELSRR